jgi:hypothetical protein
MKFLIETLHTIIKHLYLLIHDADHSPPFSDVENE